MSQKYKKNDFHYIENPFLIIGMQDSFKKTIPLNGKIKLAVAGICETRRKKWFPLATKPVSPNWITGLV